MLTLLVLQSLSPGQAQDPALETERFLALYTSIAMRQWGLDKQNRKHGGG